MKIVFYGFYFPKHCKEPKTMKFILFILGFLLLFNISISAQTTASLQLNGGLIVLLNSQNGFTGSLQFNYPLNNKIQLYAYTGYSSWGKTPVSFRKLVWSSTDVMGNFKSFKEDNHISIPVFLGARFSGTNKHFTAFLSLETGYSYLRYNSYENHTVTDPVSGEITALTVIEDSKKTVSENVLGIGFGTGISRPITERIDLVLAFRINTSYDNPLGRKNTFIVFNAGIACDI